MQKKAEVKNCRFSHVRKDDFISCCRDLKNAHPAHPIKPSSMLEGGGRSLRETARVGTCVRVGVCVCVRVCRSRNSQFTHSRQLQKSVHQIYQILV